MRNQLEAIHKILNEVPIPLASKMSTIPIDISEMVETLLKKQPYERAMSYENIIQCLEKNSRSITKGTSKVTKVFFNSDLYFLPMPINNDSKAVLQYSQNYGLNGAIFNAPQLVFF
ncbi:hypothetical protein HMSSN036_87080 [Paenibacillus macerans]|nr:hypothetical protein HMSSN036_87080 [Paenibacillus macerans]